MPAMKKRSWSRKFWQTLQAFDQHLPLPVELSCLDEENFVIRDLVLTAHSLAGLGIVRFARELPPNGKNSNLSSGMPYCFRQKSIVSREMHSTFSI